MFSQAEMERAVLGALIRDRGENRHRFEPDDFSAPHHRSVFQHIDRLCLAGPWGLPQINLALGDHAQAIAEIGTLLSLACDQANLPHYATMLRRQRQLREIRTRALSLAERAQRRDTDPEALIQDARDGLQGIARHETDMLHGLHSMAEIMAEREIIGPAPLVKVGYAELDREAHIGGGSLNVIAARPGGGKSAMMLDWSVTAARSGWQVLFFSLEMSLRDVRRRLWTMFPDGPSEVANLPLWIQEPPTRKPQVSRLVSVVQEFCRTLKDRHTLVVIDYAQIVAPNRYWPSRREQVGEVIRELKAMAMAEDIPVVAGAQLSRAIEQRGPKARPQLSDLKEAGEIEEVADLVCLLHRPKADSTETLLGVAKNRHGKGHFSVRLDFHPERARFVERQEITPWSEGWQ